MTWTKTVASFSSRQESMSVLEILVARSVRMADLYALSVCLVVSMFVLISSTILLADPITYNFRPTDRLHVKAVCYFHDL